MKEREREREREREIERERERKRERMREREILTERDTYTINCVVEKQLQKEEISVNAIIDSGVACSIPID